MPEIDPEYVVVNESRDCPVAKRVRRASTSKTRRKGLLGMSKLDEESGLWIVPCEAIHTFGMKMAIDTVFIDKEGIVRKIKANLSARRIAVCLTAHSVLELAAGVIQKSGVAIGDRLLFTRFVSNGTERR